MAFKLIEKRYDPIQKAERMGFLCDTEDDIANLPSAAPGSTAMVVATGVIYMVNASGEWAKFGG